MAFANAADGRVAAHRAHGFDGVGQQQGTQPHARSGQARLGTGVTAADHDDVEGFGVMHGGHSGKGNCTA
jgi:hypothetical protein